jgi:quinoprotein glucose dehydrogenase
MVTAGGLVFTAAAADAYLRAFDAKTGEEVWTERLPAPAQSTPMTFVMDGKQYVVVSAGGHASRVTERGDSVVAFALPR